MKPTLNLYDASQTRDVSKLAPAKGSTMSTDIDIDKERLEFLDFAPAPLPGYWCERQEREFAVWCAAKARATLQAPTHAAADDAWRVGLKGVRERLVGCMNPMGRDSHYNNGSNNALRQSVAEIDEVLDGTSPGMKSAAPLPRQAAVGLSDTDRMDLVAKSGVRGSTYKGITSINVIVHEDDLLCGGARYAIDCMIERDSAAPTVKAGQ